MKPKGGTATRTLSGGVAGWSCCPGLLAPAALPDHAHSPAEEGLLQALAGGEGLPSEHVAHDDLQAAGHEGQHGLGLEGAAAGDQAQALQRGALAQGLEELGVGAEVGLLQPAERGQCESRRRTCRVLLAPATDSPGMGSPGLGPPSRVGTQLSLASNQTLTPGTRQCWPGCSPRCGDTAAARGDTVLFPQHSECPPRPAKQIHLATQFPKAQALCKSLPVKTLCHT